MHFASISNNPEIIKTLIKEGAVINPLTERLETPIFLASAFNATESVKTLLEFEADVTLPNDLGQEPISVAYKNNNKEIIQLLYKKKE